MDNKNLRADLARLKAEETRLRAGQRTLDDDKATDRADKSKAMAYSLLGFEFAGIFAGATFGAHYLDKHLGTSPWLTLVGITAGFALALYRLIFVARSLAEPSVVRTNGRR